VPELNRVFGDHTLLSRRERAAHRGTAVPDEDESEAGQVVKVASWQDANRTRLTAHSPEPSDVIVELGPDGSELTH
jgi:hypothetical protein